MTSSCAPLLLSIPIPKSYEASNNNNAGGSNNACSDKPFDFEGSVAKDGRKCDKMSFAYGYRYVAPFCNNNLHIGLSVF